MHKVCCPQRRVGIERRRFTDQNHTRSLRSEIVVGTEWEPAGYGGCGAIHTATGRRCAKCPQPSLPFTSTSPPAPRTRFKGRNQEKDICPASDTSPQDAFHYFFSSPSSSSSFLSCTITDQKCWPQRTTVHGLRKIAMNL